MWTFFKAPRHELQSSVGHSHVAVRKLHTEFCILNAATRLEGSNKGSGVFLETKQKSFFLVKTTLQKGTV